MTVHRFTPEDKPLMQRVATALVVTARVLLILAAAVVSLTEMDDPEIRLRDEDSSLMSPLLGEGEV